jgi:HEAT repeat protein
VILVTTQTLAALGNPRAVPLLLSAIALVATYQRRSLEQALTSCLEQIHDPRVFDYLLEGLASPEQNVRFVAAERLVNLYRGQKLDEHQKQMLLAKKEEIAKISHSDNHTDQTVSGPGCGDTVGIHSDQHLSSSKWSF